MAIVTGAARGIGAATAQRLADDGRLVVAVDVDADALADRWRGDDRVTALVGDVGDPSTGPAAVDRAARLGVLDALVCNAGAPVDRAFAVQDDEEWAAVLRTGLDGTRLMTRAVVRHMQAAAAAELAAGPDATPRPRRIVATTTAASVTGTAGGSASAAAGGAVTALVATLARELGGYGIRVNGVMVGYVTTRLTDRLDPATGRGLPEPVRQVVAATTALGRMGDPAEVAAVHAFLLSPDADYVTGAVLPVTGGLLGT